MKIEQPKLTLRCSDEANQLGPQVCLKAATVCTHHCLVVFFSPKADTHFTISWRRVDSGTAVTVCKPRAQICGSCERFAEGGIIEESGNPLGKNIWIRPALSI